MSKLAVVALVLFLFALSIPWSGDPSAQDRTAPFHVPSAAHWLGTDGLGRDVLARLVAGTRLSLAAGALATGVAITIAAIFGAIAGYFQGWRDDAIMRTGELFQSLPWIYFVLGVRGLLPLSLPPARALLAIALVAGLTGWTRPARLIRGVVLAASRKDYVTAARSFGAGAPYLLRRHIIPDAMPVILVQTAQLLPQFIVAEVTLSFLGIGIGEPAPSLGGMLGALRDLHTLVSYPWMLAPAGVLLALTAGSYACSRRMETNTPGLH